MMASRVNLKGWQQAVVAVGSAFGALLDPIGVCCNVCTSVVVALDHRFGSFPIMCILQISIAKEILLERPRVIWTQVSRAWDMPKTTFGAAYALLMGSRNFSHDDRPHLHDFWHMMFGLPTNLMGETALKVIKFEQMFLPMCMLSVHYLPWVSKAGLRTTDLMSVYYVKHFHEDLEEVRRNCGIVSCPHPKTSSA
ncbi:hypothetical protein ZWY2020_025976 [Hordeum vulgare]|nr:hypothetical protein ZWY2020_025976 [Hordeum vulgare]